MVGIIMDNKKFNELMDFLAKDEEEAIKGYDDIIAQLGDDPVVEQLKKIRDEEENHLNFLREVKENHSLVYVDEHDDENEEDDRKAALKLFGLE